MKNTDALWTQVDKTFAEANKAFAEAEKLFADEPETNCRETGPRQTLRFTASSARARLKLAVYFCRLAWKALRFGQVRLHWNRLDKQDYRQN